MPVFREDHAQTKRWSAVLIQSKRIALQAITRALIGSDQQRAGAMCGTVRTSVLAEQK
jgi:hypothetical protein